MPDALAPADLLAHAGFVRSVARRILSGDEADDVAQDALLAAIETPPRERATLRSWLATVVRRRGSNARRTTARRMRRERAAARPEAACSAADLAARAEILRVVADAVAALDPGPRRLVLLRHYEGLPPREIAVRLSIPVETVRSGLSRAHARLRERLDERERGNVGGRRSALAGLVGVDVAKTGAPVGGGIAVASATKVGVGVAAVACVAGGLWWGAERLRGSEPAGAPPAPALEEARDAEGPRLAARAEPAAASPVAARKAKTQPVLPGWERRGLGRIQLDVPQAWSETPGTVPGSATWAPIRPEDPRIAFGVFPSDVAASMSRGELVASRAVVVGDHAAKREEYERRGNTGVVVSFAEPDPPVVLVMMGPKATWERDGDVLERILASVRVLTEPAAVGPGAETDEPSAAYLDSLRTPITGLVAEGTILRGAKPTAGVSVDLLIDTPGNSKVEQHATTDAAGAFRFEDLRESAYVLDVGSGGETRVQVHFSIGRFKPRPRLVVVLGVGTIEGFAYDRVGRPAAGLRVEAWMYEEPRRTSYGAVVRADGSYRIDALPARHWALGLSLSSGREVMADTRSASVDLRWGETKRVDLGSSVPEAMVRGRLLSPGGTAITGPAVHVTFERIGGSGTVFALVDDAGRYAQRLPPGDWMGRVSGSAFGRSNDFRVQVGATDVDSDVRLEDASLRGILWDLATGAKVPVDRTTLVFIEPAVGGAAWPTGVAIDGSFTFHGVPAGSYRLHAETGTGPSSRRSPAVVVEVTGGRDVLDLRLELPAK